MLYLIGLGLSDEKDITVRGLEIVKRAKRVYLEAYTAILLVHKDKLEEFYGRDVIEAGRDMVESDSDSILQDAQTEDIAFLVVGDPFSATTHSDLVLRARSLSIPVRSIPNASILTAVGSTGLQLYNFGQTVSMVFFTETWKPASFYDRLIENRSLGLHTLILLDIKVREPSLEALARGKVVYEPPRYMTASQCASQMVEVEQLRRNQARKQEERRQKAESKTESDIAAPATADESDDDEDANRIDINKIIEYGVCAPDALCVAISRAGSDTETIVSGTLEELASEQANERLGGPLHSLVLLGTKVHELEMEMLVDWAMDRERFVEIWGRDYSGPASPQWSV